MATAVPFSRRYPMRRGMLVAFACGLLLTGGPRLSAQKGPQKAIDRVKGLGGKYTVDRGGPGGPAVVVYLESTKVRDADLVLLDDLPETTHLDLTTTAVADPGLAHLRGLSKLRVLGLARTRVTDAGLG